MPDILRGKKNNAPSDSGRVLGEHFENLIHNAEFPSAQKDLLRPGDDPRELLMRTYFQNERKVNLAVRLLKRFDEVGMSKRYSDMVLNKLAAMCSLGGMSRAELVMLLSGVVSSKYVEVAAKQRSGGMIKLDQRRNGKNEEQEKEEE